MTPTVPFSALIEARNVGLETQGRQLLEAVDLRIEAGEIVTLIGLNGAGKSTLVRILLGLMAPTTGTTQRRPGLTIGYTPQHVERDVTLPLNVAAFLRLAGRFEPDEIARVLDRVEAKTTTATPLAALSGGEMQRVLLARALLRKPQLLVLDEPLAGVDLTGEAELYNLISDIRDETGAGVLLVSHDIHFVMARADKVVFLNRRVLCSGPPQQVANHPLFRGTFGAGIAESLAVYSHHDHVHDHNEDHHESDEADGGGVHG